MPKVSKASAAHMTMPGWGENYQQEAGDWTVEWELGFVDIDEAPFFKGAPGDMCQAHHMGYVLKGKMGIRKADGTEETFEAGDAFVIEPGHTPISYAGLECVVFTRTEEAKQQLGWMMPNILKYAKEHGIELPAQMTPA